LAGELIIPVKIIRPISTPKKDGMVQHYIGRKDWVQPEKTENKTVKNERKWRKILIQDALLIQDTLLYLRRVSF
jgi:hypothetical protein